MVSIDNRRGGNQSLAVTADGTGSRRTTLARLVTMAPRVLAKHLWALPLLGAVIFALVGLWVRSRVEESTRAELAARLQTVLQADINALRLWFTEREYDAKSLALDLRVQGAIAELAALAKDTNTTEQALADPAPARTLRFQLQPLLQAQDYLEYVVVSPDKRILAATEPWMVGTRTPRPYDIFLNKALDGQLVASRPFARQANQGQRTEGPTMFVAAPVVATPVPVAHAGIAAAQGQGRAGDSSTGVFRPVVTITSTGTVLSVTGSTFTPKTCCRSASVRGSLDCAPL